MSLSLPKLERSRVTDDVYHVLRQHILKQHLEAGERLRVDEMAEQLDVSRTPLREALNRLATENLVKIVPRSGTFVREITAQEIEEVFDLRYALEGHAVEQLAKCALPAEELRGLQEWKGSSPETNRSSEDRVVEHAEANRSFHERLMALTGNHKLIQMYHTLNAHTMIAYVHHAAPDALEERNAMEREEHEAILEALQEGNAKKARRAMEEHVNRARRSLIGDVERSGAARTDGAESQD